MPSASLSFAPASAMVGGSRGTRGGDLKHLMSLDKILEEALGPDDSQEAKVAMDLVNELNMIDKVSVSSGQAAIDWLIDTGFPVGSRYKGGLHESRSGPAAGEEPASRLARQISWPGKVAEDVGRTWKVSLHEGLCPVLLLLLVLPSFSFCLLTIIRRRRCSGHVHQPFMKAFIFQRLELTPYRFKRSASDASKVKKIWPATFVVWILCLLIITFAFFSACRLMMKAIHRQRGLPGTTCLHARF